MAAIPFYKSVYGTHFLAGDSRRSHSLDHRAMAGATVSYRLRCLSFSAVSLPLSHYAQAESLTRLSL